jgi:hypothetical protein
VANEFNLPLSRQIYFDGNGRPLAAGQVFTFEPASETPKLTFQDPFGDFANSNPVILDSSGSWPIFGQGNYRVIVKDSSGNTISDGPSAAGFVASASTGQITPATAVLTGSAIALTVTEGAPVVGAYALGVSYVFTIPAGTAGPFTVNDVTGGGAGLGAIPLLDTPGISNTTTLVTDQLCLISYSPVENAFVLINTPIPVNTTTEAPNFQLFTTSGTWVCPAGVTQVFIDACAGGGGGGGGSGTVGNSGGGGGGAGAAVQGQAAAVSPALVYNIVVGTGGTGGSSASGSIGGTTSMISATSVTLTSLAGGLGGAAGTSSTDAAGGAPGGSGGLNGGPGHVVTVGIEGNTGTVQFSCGGYGGGGFFGSGGSLTIGATMPGQTPGEFGGGGSGSANTNAGGNGAPGRLFLSWGAPTT